LPPAKKLYDAKESAVTRDAIVQAKKEGEPANNMWAVPILGCFAMFAMVAGVYRAASKRSRRDVNVSHLNMEEELGSQSEEALLAELE
jgi:hypothetical protein